MNATPDANPSCPQGRRLSRRGLFVKGALAVGGAALPLAAARYALRQPAGARGSSGRVFVARGQSYDGPIARTIRDGLTAVGLGGPRLAGKTVLLKPSMVEPNRAARHVTTHPAVVAAALEVFRGWGANVVVAEGPGHVRDTGWALAESGLDDALAEHRQGFIDLNYEDVQWVRNAGRLSTLDGLYLPRLVMAADLIVSLPKLKTHHWVGMTASMKNLYGVVPGIMYGWPKNVLHQAGIPQTVVDINASVPRTVAVVDAIDCMEGDGPIMGDLKRMGLLVVGDNLTAVDATCARIMGLSPARIPYLELAGGRLGPVEDHRIAQRGERWESVVSPFRTLRST